MADCEPLHDWRSLCCYHCVVCAGVFYWRLRLEFTDMTQNEMQKVWEALRLIYGSDLTAATLVVLVKDGNTAVKFQTMHFPQETEK
jgi:hypothetical protein